MPDPVNACTSSSYRPDGYVPEDSQSAGAGQTVNNPAEARDVNQCEVAESAAVLESRREDPEKLVCKSPAPKLGPAARQLVKSFRRSPRPNVSLPRAEAGPSYEQVRNDDRVGLGAGLASVGSATGTEVVTYAPVTQGGMLGAGLAAGGPLATLYTLVQIQAGANEQAQARQDAMRRDAANLAYVYAGARALPSTYLDAMRYEYRGSEAGAQQALSRIMRDDEQYQALRSEVESSVREGRAAAKGQLSSREQLDQRLASDPAFRERYSTDAGFRHGVNAELMLAERGYKQ